MELYTIVTFNQIISFVPAHLGNPDIFTPFLAWDNGSENIDVFRVYRDIIIVPISSKVCM